MRPRTNAVALVVAASLTVACTGSDPAPLATTPTQPTVTVTSTTPTEQGSTASDDVSDAPVALGLEAWQLWWQQWETVAWPPGNGGELAPFTAPEVVDSQLAFLSEWAPPAPVTATPNPEIIATTADSITLADCVLMVPPPSALLSQVGVPVTATLDYDGLGWEVSSLNIATEGTCVPVSMEEPAIAAWRTFWQRWPEVWAEPDPDAAVIGEIATGNALTYFEQNAAASVAQGWRLLGTLAELEPRATGVAETLDGPAVTVVDCAVPADGFGTYDGDGGPPITALGPDQVWLARGTVVAAATGPYLVSEWTIEPADREACTATVAGEATP